MNDQEITQKGERHPCQPLNSEEADRFVAQATEDLGGHWTWQEEDGKIVVYAYFPKDDA